MSCGRTALSGPFLCFEAELRIARGFASRSNAAFGAVDGGGGFRNDRGGSTTWEKCALGLPSAAVAVASNQEAICARRGTNRR